jgi:hypothetical protein
MPNPKTNEFFHADVEEPVRGAVDWAVNWAVNWAVYGAVEEAMYWNVNRAVIWTVGEDRPPPGLQDFLCEVGLKSDD